MRFKIPAKLVERYRAEAETWGAPWVVVDYSTHFKPPMDYCPSYHKTRAEARAVVRSLKNMGGPNFNVRIIRF